MKKQNPWISLKEEEKHKILEFSEKYKKFLSTIKTERESIHYAIQKAKEKGFTCSCEKQELKPGDKNLLHMPRKKCCSCLC